MSRLAPCASAPASRWTLSSDLVVAPPPSPPGVWPSSGGSCGGYEGGGGAGADASTANAHGGRGQKAVRACKNIS